MRAAGLLSTAHKGDERQAGVTKAHTLDGVPWRDGRVRGETQSDSDHDPTAGQSIRWLENSEVAGRPTRWSHRARRAAPADYTVIAARARREGSC